MTIIIPKEALSAKVKKVAVLTAAFDVGEFNYSIASVAAFSGL